MPKHLAHSLITKNAHTCSPQPHYKECPNIQPTASYCTIYPAVKVTVEHVNGTGLVIL